MTALSRLTARLARLEANNYASAESDPVRVLITGMGEKVALTRLRAHGHDGEVLRAPAEDEQQFIERAFTETGALVLLQAD
jgi:hypothetical protein